MNPLPAPELDTAAQVPWDVLVVGAGPAGALTARELARRGRGVLLVDKASFPREKVCGCTFNLAAQSALAAAGLGDLLHEVGAVPLEYFGAHAAGRHSVLRLPGAMALSRAAFDYALVRQACDAGAVFLPATHCALDAAEADFRLARLRQGSQEAIVRARIVVVAFGLGGSASIIDQAVETRRGSRIGAGAVIESDAPYAPGTVHIACGRGGYVGLVRLEDGRLDMAAAFDPEHVRQSGGLARAASRILEQAGCDPVPEAEAARWRGTPALTRRAESLAGHRLFRVGDAAGYVEPFTGEGIAWALAGALALAPLAHEAAVRYDARLEARWAAVLKRQVQRRQWVCRLLASGLRHPALVSAAVAITAVCPLVAAPVLHHLNAPIPTKGTFAP